MKQNKKTLKITLGILFLIIIGVALYNICSLNLGVEDIKNYVQSFGKIGPLVYIVMFALVPLTFFPDSILAIAGGLIFGLLKGYIYTAIGALIPLFPFDVISYGAGLTSVKYKDFILATFFGTIPGILVFTNLGAEAVNIGSTSFYISIALLILLFIVSIFLKNKFISKELKNDIK